MPLTGLRTGNTLLVTEQNSFWPELGHLNKTLGKRRYQTVSPDKILGPSQEKSGAGRSGAHCGLVSAAGELKIEK
jgi:hypothetical protein